MAGYVRSLITFLVTEQCYREFFVNYNFLDVPCLKIALSKGLGYGIIAGSVMVKLPQILKILQNESAEGLSISSVLMDLYAITSSVAYQFIMDFPFSAWGEGFFLIIQTATIAALIFHYNGSTERAIGFMATYMLLLAVLMGGATPVTVLWFMQALNVPILVVGKLLQALANYQNGSTGQLSAITVFMLLFGSTARIFTSIQETGDAILVVTYVCAATVNLIVAAQLVYYWNSAGGREGGSNKGAAKRRVD